MFRFHWKCFWTIIITTSTLLRVSKIFESLVWWAPIFVALPSIKYVGKLSVVGWSCLLFYCCWLIWPFVDYLILAGIAYGNILLKSPSLISNQLLGISSLLNGNNLRWLVIDLNHERLSLSIKIETSYWTQSASNNICPLFNRIKRRDVLNGKDRNLTYFGKAVLDVAFLQIEFRC